jgi:Terminase large subunit, T4likevirus-type, N-terminal
MGIATDLAMALSPVRMAESAGITLDPWQADMVCSTSPRLLLNCSRQSGKSLDAAVLADHTALYEPGSLVLLLSPSLRQSQELFRQCLTIYRALDRPVPAEAESALRLELENHSRIISLPGNETTIRGLSGVKLLIIDEASRVPDELYMAVRPMLAVSGGRLVLLSTPFGTRGFFYEAWRNRAAWDYYQVEASQCPRISPAFLEEEKAVMHEYFYSQEYECIFRDAQEAAFRSTDIESIVSEMEVEQWSL